MRTDPRLEIDARKIRARAFGAIPVEPSMYQRFVRRQPAYTRWRATAWSASNAASAGGSRRRQCTTAGVGLAAHLIAEGKLSLRFCSEVAEREGFEPPIRLPVCRISSAVHSTTLPPLRRCALGPSTRAMVGAAISMACKRAQGVAARPFTISGKRAGPDRESGGGARAWCGSCRNGRGRCNSRPAQ
jgi:hypothetical protein